MSAASARDELESAIWRASSAPVHATDRQHMSDEQVDAILAAADAYAEAVADDRIAGHVASRSQGRERLAEAAAEAHGKAAT